MNKNTSEYTHQRVIDALLEGVMLKSPYKIDDKEFKKFSSIQLLKMIEKFGVPEGEGYWGDLANTKDVPDVFAALNQRGFDLMRAGGILLFQSVCGLKKKNVEYLASITPINHRSVYLSIINLPSILKKEKKKPEEYDLIIMSLMKRVTPDFYNTEIGNKIVDNREYFNSAMLRANLNNDNSGEDLKSIKHKI